MIMIDGLWYSKVMSKLGNDQALNCDISHMKKPNPLMIEAICGLMNMKCSDSSVGGF